MECNVKPHSIENKQSRAARLEQVGEKQTDFARTQEPGMTRTGSHMCRVSSAAIKETLVLMGLSLGCETQMFSGVTKIQGTGYHFYQVTSDHQLAP